MLKIVEQPIDENAVLQSVKSPLCGACVLFVGTTRQMTGDVETKSLEYEAYVEMAVKELEKLRDRALAKWPDIRCSMVHRIGTVPIGQTSVAVAVSSPHRIASFEAASWLMDTLKQEVPIWKKETWVNGTDQWIHPEPNKQTPLPNNES